MFGHSCGGREPEVTGPHRGSGHKLSRPLAAGKGPAILARGHLLPGPASSSQGVVPGFLLRLRPRLIRTQSLGSGGRQLNSVTSAVTVSRRGHILRFQTDEIGGDTLRPIRVSAGTHGNDHNLPGFRLSVTLLSWPHVPGFSRPCPHLSCCFCGSSEELSEAPLPGCISLHPTAQRDQGLIRTQALPRGQRPLLSSMGAANAAGAPPVSPGPQGPSTPI